MLNKIMPREAGSRFAGKKILIAGLAIMFLAGCGAPKVPGAQDNNIFTSIRDAVTKSISLRCDYKDTDGQVTVTYVKGQTIRMMEDQTQDNETISVNGLIKDNKMYIWSSQSKDGLVMDLATLQNSDDTKMGDTVIHSTDDIINELEKEKNNCRQETMPAGTFDIPGDINFQDFSNFNFGM